jgi:hypothetical protein
VDPEAMTIEVFELIGTQFVLAHVASGSASVQSPLLPALRLAPSDLLTPEF